MTNEDFAEFNAYRKWGWFDTSPIYIYGLIDPETEECRYIGKSERPVERLQNHMNDRSNCHRSHWLQSLKRRGMKPRMVILEVVEPNHPIEWQLVEKFWIAKGREWGWPLTNNTSGGDGVDGLPAETRARMAAVWKGRKHTPEAIEKMRAANIGRKHSDEHKAHMSRLMRGRVVTWSDKLAEAIRKLTDEQVQTIKRRLDSGELGIALSREYGVHRTTISKIKLGTYYDRYRA